MMGRALLAIAIVGMTLHHAGAQFGDTPGLPGGPPGGSPAETFRDPSHSPPGPQHKCRALLTIRDELQKHGQAIEAANQKRADVKIACGLFRNYIATEAKMIKMLEADGASCGAPPQVIQQVRSGHAKARQIGKQVCDAAARGPNRHELPPLLPPPDDEYLRRYNPDRDRRERWRLYQQFAGPREVLIARHSVVNRRKSAASELP